ncbi:MAG: T9SS type A sorting domain-containing protein [Bacteroidetes bacterium]|nr:T9SS type A sorting domain-containing protein [Bacteroidota bacterium]MCL2302976.1 T9SS type A sorting domain-containing protein [Lentimicrobiaceae bacterium]
MRKIIFIFFILTFSYLGYGQLSQGGLPYTLQLSEDRNGKELSADIPVLNMPHIDQSIIDELKADNDSVQGYYQFAYPFDVNIDLKEAAIKDSLDCGILYRLAIRSPGAYSINIIFSEYAVPPCAKLFMYNETHEHIIGAYTSNNNKEFKVFAVSPVAGEKIILEYFEPYISDYEGTLIIGKINHDFMDFLNILKEYDSKAKTCHISINSSPEGDNWQNEKRAVCYIVVNGNKTGTGTLINNTNNDGKAYILTSTDVTYHQDDDKSSIFYFTDEAPTFTSTYKSISGAKTLAGHMKTGYVLLEMSKQPLSSFRPYFAGWDRNDSQSAGGVGIYHSGSNGKGIATFSMVPETANCNDVNGYKINWIATENGHGIFPRGYGGGALFNAQKRIIGQHTIASHLTVTVSYLKCKAYSCKNADKVISTFGKLFSSWDIDDRLKGFLDPTSTGVFVLDGIDACTKDAGIYLNLDNTISSGSFTFRASDIESTSIIQSGANVKYIAGENIILKPGFHAQSGSQFQAKIESSDCVQVPVGINLVAWTNYACADDGLNFSITNATHYTVKISSNSGVLVYSGSGSIIGNSVTVWSASGVVAGYYTANITFSSSGDEISNSYRILVMYCKSNSSIEPSKDLIEPSKDSYNIQEISNDKFDFTIYPNPNDGNFIIQLLTIGEMKPFSFQIFSSSGKLISGIEHCNTFQIHVNYSHLPAGIYFVKLSMGNNITVKKVIVQ